VPPGSLVSLAGGEASAAVAARIGQARQLQVERRGGLNAVLSGGRLRAACGLGASERARVVSLAEGLELSARGVERLLRTARTVADLDGSELVGRRHLEEVGRFRALGVRSVAQLAV
jgi:magnesium chelatase family protein